MATSHFVNGHLGCLASNAFEYLFVHKSFFCEHTSSNTLGMYLVVELLGHMYGNFVKTAELFPKRLYHFTFSPPLCKGFNFSTSSPTLGIVHLF